LQQAGRDADPTVVEADADRRERVLVVLLAAVGALGARDRIVEQLRPIGRADECFHRIDRHSGGIQAAHERPHARARDAVDRDVLRLDLAQHADVGDATRAAAAEREADAGARVAGLASTAPGAVDLRGDGRE
jgi:hypothetical protein